MATIGECGDLAAFEAYISSCPDGHFLQSPRWAAQKSNWGCVCLEARDGSGELCGGVLALTRRLPGTGRSLMVCARGPVCGGDMEIAGELLRGLIECAKRKKCFCLRLEPGFLRDDPAAAFLPSLGFVRRDGAYQGLHPHILWRKDIAGLTPEELLSGFSQKTRYNVRLAMRKGVRVRERGAEGIPEWFALLRQTGERDGFFVRNEDYYRRMAALFGADFRLYLAEYAGEPVGGIIVLSYAGKSWYLYGASGDAHRNCKAAELLHYTALCGAAARGDRVYDFRGVSGYSDESDPGYGIYRFKKGFGGELVTLAGSFELVLNRPVYIAARLGYSMRKKLRRGRNRA